MGHTQDNPRVTWLLPVQNGQPFLDRTLASIARQTYRDFEVLAWDNGSTDGTVDLLRRWIPQRLPGRVVVDRPLGLGASLAAMVIAARSPYCARIDADDVNEPTRLEKQVSLLEARPTVAVVGTSVRYIDEQDQELPQWHTPALSDAEVRWRLRFCNAMSHPTVTFRRGMVLSVGNYRDIMPIEDYELWLRVALRYQMVNLPQPLVRYRVRLSSVCAAHHDRIDGFRHDVILKYAEALFPGLSASERQRLCALLQDYSRRDVCFHDYINFRRTAGLAAVHMGAPVEYFRNTTLYRTQSKSLFLRWIKSTPGVGSAWRVFQQRTRRAA